MQDPGFQSATGPAASAPPPGMQGTRTFGPGPAMASGPQPVTPVEPAPVEVLPPDPPTVVVEVELPAGRGVAPVAVMAHHADGRFWGTVWADNGLAKLEVPAGGMVTAAVPGLRYSSDDLGLTTVSGVQDGDVIPMGFAGEPTRVYGEVPTTSISFEPWEGAASYFAQSSCGRDSSSGEPFVVDTLIECSNVDGSLDVVAYALDADEERLAFSWVQGAAAPIEMGSFLAPPLEHRVMFWGASRAADYRASITLRHGKLTDSEARLVALGAGEGGAMIGRFAAGLFDEGYARVNRDHADGFVDVWLPLQSPDTPSNEVIDLSVDLPPAVEGTEVVERERLGVAFTVADELSCRAGEMDRLAVSVRGHEGVTFRSWFLMADGGTRGPVLFPELDPELAEQLWPPIDPELLRANVAYFADDTVSYDQVRQSRWGLRPEDWGPTTRCRSEGRSYTLAGQSP